MKTVGETVKKHRGIWMPAVAAAVLGDAVVFDKVSVSIMKSRKPPVTHLMQVMSANIAGLSEINSDFSKVALIHQKAKVISSEISSAWVWSMSLMYCALPTPPANFPLQFLQMARKYGTELGVQSNHLNMNLQSMSQATHSHFSKINKLPLGAKDIFWEFVRTPSVRSEVGNDAKVLSKMGGASMLPYKFVKLFQL